MPLTNVTKFWGGFDPTIGLYMYCGIMEWISNPPERYRQIEDNINLLRSKASFAYLIENETLEVLQERWNKPGNPERAYYEALPKKQLRRGGWFDSPLFEQHVETTITAVGQGDIYPFVDAMYDDWHQILCLPTPESVETIDEIVYSSASTATALVKLLTKGGFLVSCIDFEFFRVMTLDTGYEEFFPKE